GWTTSYVGVRHARRGDIPNWEFLFRPVRHLIQSMARQHRPFADPARAQVWFEWRRTGLGLPISTGVVLPFLLLFLGIGKDGGFPPTQTLLGALLVPVFLAGLAGTAVSGKHPWVKDYYGVAPSTATL